MSIKKPYFPVRKWKIRARRWPLVLADLLSCSIGLSCVNFVSPLGLGCSWWWWWLSILGSPDTAALGWCGPRWNPTAMPSSNSSASSVPFMVYTYIHTHTYILYYLYICEFIPPSFRSRPSSFFLFACTRTHIYRIFFFLLYHYPLNGIMFSRATDALSRPPPPTGPAEASRRRTYASQRSANSICSAARTPLFHGRRERSVARSPLVSSGGIDDVKSNNRRGPLALPLHP